MINGEGTHDTLSGVASTYPPPLSSPQYSSCGESEFERYCSANLVMGTPNVGNSSFRTFNDWHESEFGSLKSLGIGDGINLEDFRLAVGHERKLDTGKPSSSSHGFGSFHDPNISSWQEKTGMHKKCHVRGVHLYDNDEDYSMLQVNAGDNGALGMSDFLGFGALNDNLNDGLSEDDDQEISSDNLRHNDSQSLPSEAENLYKGKKSLGDSVDEMPNSRIGSSSSDGVKKEGLGMDMQSDERETGLLSEEKEHLCSDEHSEGEESMFGYGTDNENEAVSRHKQYVQNSSEENVKGVNAFVTNSSTAFGSDDWDDFERERASSSSFFIVSNTFENKQRLNNDLKVNSESCSSSQMEFLDDTGPEHEEDANHGECHIAESTDCLESCSVKSNGQLRVSGRSEQEKKVKNILRPRNSSRGTNNLAGSQNISVDNEVQLESQVRKDPLSADLNDILDVNGIFINRGLGISPNSSLHRVSKDAKSKPETYFEDKKPEALPLMFKNRTENMFCSSSFSVDLFDDLSSPTKARNIETNQSYDDVVNEMEEILLESCNSPGMGFYDDNPILQSGLTHPSRDGGSTSTTGKYEAFSVAQRHLKQINGIEVIGAKQKKGDVSFGERLVGVNEYTVYIIRVRSGKDQWEVERRYRDFLTLFQRLQSLFTDHGLVLPSPWSSVERESTKIFGYTSPDVVAERSSIIQECLCSILYSRILSGPPSALVVFLSPRDNLCNSPASSTSWPTFLRRAAGTDNIYTLGKTVSLVVEIRPYKSKRQLLEVQYYTCAGCHQHFDDGKTMMQDFVQSMGWGKHRLCEYTGQLFCSSCHTSETTILPARVLHFWDFTQYPVSQLAKSYIDSLHDQPMLCVGAVNPFLFSKVPAMLHIMNIRKKVGAMFPYVRCPFRMSINKSLGSRSYLLDSNDFFALRDLIDLSKGTFAALPNIVEKASREILEHITEQCLICCDVGLPCGARGACIDQSSLIFPFQESETERCKACQMVFHRRCFKLITDCPCGLQLIRLDEPTPTLTRRLSNDEGPLDLIKSKLTSALSANFLSGLFSTSRNENQQGHRRDGDPVILMGSLPNTSL